MKKGLSIALLLIAISCGVFGHYHVSQRQLPAIQWHKENPPQGVFHVHSEASHDSKITVEEIAQVATDMKLDFVVLTNHNSQQPPFNKNKITFLSYAELSTRFGHVIQFGADTLLSQTQRNQMDLGPMLSQNKATAIIAHPTDPKRPWNGRWRDIGGIEIASASASFRKLGGPLFVGLLPSLASYQANKTLALAQLYYRDHKALSRWDENPNPNQIGICGVDAHGRIDLQSNLDLWRLQLEIDLPQKTSQRATAITEAIQQGKFHCVATLFGRKAEFYFEARQDNVTVGTAGDSVPANAIDNLIVQAPMIRFPQKGQQLTMVLMRNGEEVLRQHGRQLSYQRPSPGTYRVEIRIPVPNILIGYRSVPIIYSNKIRVLASENAQ